jgi:hypothetical protein
VPDPKHLAKKLNTMLEKSGERINKVEA